MVVGGAVCVVGPVGGGLDRIVSGDTGDCGEGATGDVDEVVLVFTAPGAGGTWILDSLGWELKEGSELNIESLSGFLVSANDLRCG
jgi:hypothetical protein